MCSENLHSDMIIVMGVFYLQKKVLRGAYVHIYKVLKQYLMEGAPCKAIIYTRIFLKEQGETFT